MGLLLASVFVTVSISFFIFLKGIVDILAMGGGDLNCTEAIPVANLQTVSVPIPVLRWKAKEHSDLQIGSYQIVPRMKMNSLLSQCG